MFIIVPVQYKHFSVRLEWMSFDNKVTYYSPIGDEHIAGNNGQKIMYANNTLNVDFLRPSKSIPM